MSDANTDRMRAVFDFLSEHLDPPQFVLFYRGSGDHVHILTNQEQDQVQKLCDTVANGEVTWKQSYIAAQIGSC